MRNLAEVLAEELRLSLRPNLIATGATRKEVARLAESLAALAFSHLLDHPDELVDEGVLAATGLRQVPDVDVEHLRRACESVQHEERAGAVDHEFADENIAEARTELEAVAAVFMGLAPPHVYDPDDDSAAPVPSSAPALYRFTR